MLFLGSAGMQVKNDAAPFNGQPVTGVVSALGPERTKMTVLLSGNDPLGTMPEDHQYAGGGKPTEADQVLLWLWNNTATPLDPSAAVGACGHCGGSDPDCSACGGSGYILAD